MSKTMIYAVIALVLVSGVTYTLMTVYNEGYDNGYATAEKEAQAATDKAIKDLANNADRADVAFQLCVDGGRVWDFVNNKCAE